MSDTGDKAEAPLVPFHFYRIHVDGSYLTLNTRKGDVRFESDYKGDDKWMQRQIWSLEPADRDKWMFEAADRDGGLGFQGDNHKTLEQMNSDGGFGFQGENHKYLGVNNNGHVGASADTVRGWERFTLEPTQNGYYFVVYWKDSKHYLFKPPNKIYLEATPHVANATPMTFEDMIP